MRSKRMQPVAKHADQKEQDAIRLFVKAQTIVEEAEKQLQQLFGYRDEYSQKLLDTESGNLSAQRLRDHQSFVAKLGQTIDQVYIDIDKKKQHCEEQRQAWLQCRARSHALNSVVEKYQQQEFNEQEKREQKEQDEYASRISTRKP